MPCPPWRRGTTGGLKSEKEIVFYFVSKESPLFPPDSSGQALLK